MKYPKIQIDYQKCIQPEECRKCVQICPPSVFNITFRDEDYHNPNDWIIDPVFPQLCKGFDCSKCLEICLTQAISIEFS
ncbi:MAG: hypothetical protein BAJALOKI3v1_90003 [Promethearchaeota archaeon]|jgi:Pyruvate/2-oxoacid:ferredoxin oxidoreductase delta subunit|nr:MAG: hypothetical protein BAJALOKI3v1_90003 [Candidatus Lokiarchaeota archaeon]